MTSKRRQKNPWPGSRVGSHLRQGGTSAPVTSPAPVINELAIGTFLGSEVVAMGLRSIYWPPYRWWNYYATPLPEVKTLLTGLPSRQFETAASITARIDAVIADNDMYEPSEPRPSPEAVIKAKELMASAEREGSRFPRPKISVYFGEIDFTWTVENRLLRLIVLADPSLPAVLYFQSDKGEALTRGESVPVSVADDLSQKLNWLLG